MRCGMRESVGCDTALRGSGGGVRRNVMWDVECGGVRYLKRGSGVWNWVRSPSDVVELCKMWSR